MKAFSHVLLAFGGLLIAAGGAWAITLESVPLVAGDTSVARVASWTASPPGIPLSITAQNLLLVDCETVLKAPDALGMRYLDQAVRDRVPATCMSIARDITETSVTSGYGWLVAAMAAAQMGDVETMNQALRRSRAVAPSEGWIAADRLILADIHYDSLDAETRKVYEDDMQLLVQTRGAADIARRYASHPQFRERITAVVETMPAAVQRRFVNLVGAALRASR